MSGKDTEGSIEGLNESDILKGELHSLRHGVESKQKTAEYVGNTFGPEKNLKKQFLLGNKLRKMEDNGSELFANKDFQEGRKEIEDKFDEAKGTLENGIT